MSEKYNGFLGKHLMVWEFDTLGFKLEHINPNPKCCLVSSKVINWKLKLLDFSNKKKSSEIQIVTHLVKPDINIRLNLGSC